MQDELFKTLEDLNIRDTKLLLDKDIKLALNYSTRKHIEKSIMKKTGYYNEKNILKDKIHNILGGNLMKKKIALALSAAVILSLAGGGYAYAKTPVAYVSMDINPSVELGVNAFDKVVSVEAYNEDGEKILEGTDLVSSNIDSAVSTVISNAISEGYINEDGSSAIEITTSSDKKNVATELDDSLKEVAEETLNENNVEAEVETEKVALARRDEARELKITPGKLNLIQKLQKLDSTITVEDYKDSSVKDIQKKTKELRKNNKSDQTTIYDSTSIDTSNNINADTVTEENEKANLSETSVDSDETTIVEQVKNDNNASDNEGNSKKEESSNVNSKKEENSNANQEQNTTETINKKQNNGNIVNSQKNSNSNLENSSNSDSKGNSSNSNSSKSGNNDNGNSNSQNKGNNKNKN